MNILNKISVYLEMMRRNNCLMASFAALLAVIIASGLLPDISTKETLTTGRVLVAVLSILLMVFLVTGAGNVLNDFYDIEIDRINRPDRALPSGRVTPREAVILSTVCFVIGVLIGWWINIYALVIGVINITLLILYAGKLKQTVLLGNMTVAYLTGSTFLFGGAFFGSEGFLTMIPLFLLSFLLTAAREIVKDIEDMEGDRACGAVTFPIRYGEKNGGYLAAFFMILGGILCPLPYLIGYFGYGYLIVISVAALMLIYSLYLLLVKKDYTKTSRLLKISMFVALISFIAGIIF